MKPIISLLLLLGMALSPLLLQAKLIFTDAFDRPDGSPTEDGVGNGWSTNSKSRAKGDKQAWLEDGKLVVRISPKADHAVSIKRDFPLGDCTVLVKFKLGEEDLLKVNFNDPNLKTSHAGHVCSVRVSPTYLEVADQMNGSMNLALRKRRLEGDNSRELKQLIAQTEKRVGIDLQTGGWHELRFELRGDTVKVFLNSVFQLEHTSRGFGHPTKENIALSVPKQATIDVLQVWDQAGRQ